MKKASVLGFFAAMALLAAAGCSESTRGDIKQVGEGMKDDINEGVRDLDRKIEDATD